MIIRRLFKVWDFNVTHKRLLIRSPKSDECTNNVDIVFWGVSYLESPTTFEDLELLPAEESEVAKVSGILNKPIEPDEVHVLASKSQRFLICAISRKIFENQLDIFVSLLDTPHAN